MASNVFDPALTPTQAAHYDFYQYGGLIREVTLHVLPPAVSLLRVRVDPLAAAGVAAAAADRRMATDRALSH